MSNLPDICGDDYQDRLAGDPAIDPFRSLNVHFGMLMGVDDFETIDAYHRGKMWLHSSWLHGRGSVWGLGVEIDDEEGEVRVGRGLAIDGWGRELYLEQPACLDIGEWFREHREDAALEVENLAGGRFGFSGHVVIDFQGCLARQVPALVEPCDTAARSTAYSRMFETVRLELRPGKAPDQSPDEFHRLRLFFGLDQPVEEGGSVVAADQVVLDARAAVRALPAADRPGACLETFRRFAAEDSIDLEPALNEEGESFLLFPNLDSAVVLAEINNVVVEADGETFAFVSSDTPDNGVRPTLVSTETVQELLCGCSCGADAEGGAPGDGPATDAGGPRGRPDTVELEALASGGFALRFRVTEALDSNTVSETAFEVSALENGVGWHSVEFEEPTYNSGQRRVSLRIPGDPPGTVLRFVARGTGATPLLGENHVPLAGAVGGPPGSAHDGHDFAFMIDRS